MLIQCIAKITVMKTLILFTLIATCLGIEVIQKIINGSKAEPGAFPYQVYLRNYKGRFVCGGSIIDKRWILTAAHCVESPIEYVVVGTNYLNRNGTFYAVKKQYSHFLYNRKSMSYDIALLKTEKPIIYKENVQPIKLASKNVEEGTELIVSGWGVKKVNTKIPKELSWTTVTVLSDEKCKALYYEDLESNQMCTMNKTSGSCFGDSGGPLVYKGYLHGIVSMGLDKNCSTTYPGVEVRVSSHIYWIYVVKFWGYIF